MELILFFLGVLYDLPGSAFADALESGLIVPALEPMCYADVWRQVAVPVRNVTSLCGGQTSGSSSSRMPSSTRRWTSVAEYSRQGRGSGTHLENFWGARKLFGADPNFSLKWLWSLPVDSTVLYYVYLYIFILPIRQFCLLLLWPYQVRTGRIGCKPDINRFRPDPLQYRKWTRSLHFKMNRIRPKDKCFSNKTLILPRAYK